MSDSSPDNLNGSPLADVVVPLGEGSCWNDNDELRFSLRALQANFLGLRRLFIVGKRPRWLSDDAIYIPAADRFPRNKDANIMEKLLRACTHPELGDRFVRCSDDELFLLPTSYGEMTPLYHGDLPRSGGRRHAWHARLRHTANYLRRRGHPTRFFDVHAPAPMRRSEFVTVAHSAPFRASGGFAVDSLYFNSTPLSRIAPAEGIVRRITAPAGSVTELRRLIGDARYLNFSEGALNHALRAFLEATFPAPSRFEVPP